MSNHIDDGWFGGRRGGTIIPKNKYVKAEITINGKRQNKSFYFEDYNNPNDNANKWLIKISIENGVMKNRIKECPIHSLCYMMKINGGGGAKICHFDKEDYVKIKKHTWYAKNDTNHSTCYVAAKINKKTVRLHRFLCPNFTMIDHDNRNGLDNRKENLLDTNSVLNSSNTKLYETNQSGLCGVYKDRHYWRAFTIINGIRKTKSFSIKRYGDKEAYKLAKEWREANKPKYNTNGQSKN